MKVELGIGAMSNIVCMSGCSKQLEAQCGIMYRMG